MSATALSESPWLTRKNGFTDAVTELAHYCTKTNPENEFSTKDNFVNNNSS